MRLETLHNLCQQHLSADTAAAQLTPLQATDLAFEWRGRLLTELDQRQLETMIEVLAPSLVVTNIFSSLYALARNWGTNRRFHIEEGLDSWL